MLSTTKKTRRTSYREPRHEHHCPAVRPPAARHGHGPTASSSPCVWFGAEHAGNHTP